MNAPLTNTALLEKDCQHMIHPLHHTSGHVDGRVWTRAEGSYLFDADGNRFIDGLSCLWNVSAGHGRQELADAAHRQMSQLAFSSSYAGGSNIPAIELAGRLAEITYPDINQFYFTSGGGESTDSNFKLARFYWKARGRPGKTKVIGRQWGYHGVTFAAMCATRNIGILADVRAENSRLQPYTVSGSLPLPGSRGRIVPGDCGRK